MRMMGFLLGTAAGLAAVAGAQAADLPVKARPVQYVKICSLYGDGFYYIPGTNTCLKLGGYVRAQTEYWAGAGGVPLGAAAGMNTGQAMQDRERQNDFNWRVRGLISLDVRDQTEYGTLRSYLRIGAEQTTPGQSNNTGGVTTAVVQNTPNNCSAAQGCSTAAVSAGGAFIDRAFIQWAGFTVGKAVSFYDGFSYGAPYSYFNPRLMSDTDLSGWQVWAYTAQFGNGFSATLSLEDPNRGALVIDTTAFGCVAACQSFGFPGATPGTDNAFGAENGVLNGARSPDIILNGRVDQAWGSASVSAALHDVAAAYYGASNLPGNPGSVANGRPADRKGWAVNAGLLLNLPGGDKLAVNGQYSVGAAGYGSASGINWSYLKPGTSAGWGLGATDGVFIIGSEIELTTVWNVIAFYEHIWNPRWRTSVYGGYASIEHSATAKTFINPAGGVCGGLGNGFGGVTLLAGNSCNPDWSFYEIGTRTQWNPHPNLVIGLDILFTHLNTAYKGPASVNPGAPQETVNFLDDQNIMSAAFRWQRNFYP